MLNLAKTLIAVAMILAGLYLVVFGNRWGPAVFESLSDSELGLWLQLIVPFLPMACIALGTALFVSHRR